MRTFFARHTRKLDIDATTRNLLWEGLKVAVHYPHDKAGPRPQDALSLDPADYSGSARRAIRALVHLARDGGYVCAQYFGQENVLVGVVEPATPIELIRGSWGNVWKQAGREAVLKGVQLRRVRQVRPSGSPAILVGRPRQGTLMEWPSAGMAIRNLVEGHIGEPQVSDLSPDQQEVLCSEFLRLPAAARLGLPTLAHLLLPTGRTMKDLDIYGLAADGKPLFAQVTYKVADHAAGKLDRLRPYRDERGSHLILFCRAQAIETVDGILRVPIDRVWAEFGATDLGRTWLDRALWRSTNEPPPAAQVG
jgi:hypothetical protein